MIICVQGTGDECRRHQRHRLYDEQQPVARIRRRQFNERETTGGTALRHGHEPGPNRCDKIIAIVENTAITIAKAVCTLLRRTDNLDGLEVLG